MARLCFQEYQLRQHMNELTAVYSSTPMAGVRDLVLLNRTVELVASIMNVKAASIRLIEPQRDELIIKAVYNLCRSTWTKGRSA